MKKIGLFVSLFVIILATGCETKKNVQVFSEWSFQCRESGDYFYEENGVLKFGSEPTGDACLWIAESTDTESVKLKNKKSGNYLQVDGNGNVVSGKAEGADVQNMTWAYKGFTIRQMTNCSWYTLNIEGKEDQFLAKSGDGLKVETLDRRTDFRSHWTVVRENGSTVPYALAPDSVVEASFLGMRVSKAISDTEILSDYHGKGGVWKLEKDISEFPVFTADNNRMIVALYNMALEEMQKNLRTDSTFATGALWPDTWTRDAVYSIYFSFSWIHKEISKNTLLKQTLKNPKEALQDTGTGGSWPISTDRVVWALAAWEYYLTTGDKDWLAQVYDGLAYTAQKDIHVAFDKNIGLYKGEACSMDWRTHTYPNWFSNENIGESFTPGTNSLHMFLYDFLTRSAKLLGKSEEEIRLWDNQHTTVKNGINNRFWDKEQGLYTSYLYPEFLNYKSSDRVDVMSNGLAILLGASDEAQINSVIEKYPLYPYGAAVLYPSIPDDFSYHNKGIWAVWQTPYMYAAKRVGNTAAVDHMMKTLIRQGAMFLTHKENMTYDTGYDRNTALNSDRQLWSVASYISIVYRMIFGMEMTETGMTFNPVISPDLIKGNVYLKNFKYRDATLNVTVGGSGNKVKSLKVNGTEQTLPYELSSTSTGNIEIVIEMMEDSSVPNKINLVEAGPRKCWSPVEPVVTSEGGKLVWKQDAGLKYMVVGANINEEVTSPYDLRGKPNGFYSVYAVDSKGFESDLSNPIVHSSSVVKYEAEEAKFITRVEKTAEGFSGNGYVLDFTRNNSEIEFTVDLPEAGTYAFALVGSNGVKLHDVYCFIRSVFVDGKDAGTFILESSGNWNQWTTSNYLILKDMNAGKHTLKLLMNPEKKGYDNNMSFDKRNENNAYLDYLKVIRL